jgi:hypothetical protein
LVLRFKRTAQGYKMRCPSCGSVVRLRVNEAPRQPQPTRRIEVELVPVTVPAEPPPPAKRRRPLLILGIIAVVTLLGVLAGVASWFWEW